MIARPPVPVPDVNRMTLPMGSELHRIHSDRFDGNTFNPCLGRSTRFAPLTRSDNSCVPTAYAASNLECAVHETVFHEIEFNAARKNITYSAVEQLAYSSVRMRRDLALAKLFEPDLNRWGLTRGDLIDTFAADYEATAKWALAIHDAHGDIDGLIWTSRRCDPERAYLLFGDRADPKDLEVLHTQRIGHNEPLLLRIREYAGRAGIFLSF